MGLMFLPLQVVLEVTLDRAEQYLQSGQQY